MTGATITSRAIARIVTKTGQRIAEPLLGLPPAVAKSSGSRPEWSIARDLRVWAVVMLFVFFVYSFYSRSPRIRLTCLVASTIVLGIWLNAPFTALDAAGLVSGEIPAFGTIWRNTLLAGILIISLLWGQAFCGFLCPFGAVQEFLSSRKLRLRASQRLEQTGRYVKYVILALLLCLFLVTSDTVWFSFSPLQHFFGAYGANFFLALSSVPKGRPKFNGYGNHSIPGADTGGNGYNPHPPDSSPQGHTSREPVWVLCLSAMRSC